MTPPHSDKNHLVVVLNRRVIKFAKSSSRKRRHGFNVATFINIIQHTATTSRVFVGMLERMSEKKEDKTQATK